jgi:DNA replication protein DnaC
MNESPRVALNRLRLSGMAASLDARLQEAAGHQLSHAEFLEMVLQDELMVRGQRQIERRTRAADFRELKTLDEFDFTFNPSIKRKQIFDLAAGHYIREGRDVLLIGPPGTGKSHIAQALGYQAIKGGSVVLYRSIFDVVRDFLHDEALNQQDRVMDRYLRADLVIIDDMGMKQLPKRSGEYLFEIIMRRNQVRSTVMTSNRPLEDWGKLTLRQLRADVPAATAILDRFLHNAEVIAITGRSYRLRNRAEPDEAPGKQQEGGRPSATEPGAPGSGGFSPPDDATAPPPASSDGRSDDAGKPPPNTNGKTGRRKDR